MNDVLAGTAAAVAGVTVAHPFDLIKTRLQTGVGGEVGALSMLRSAVASEGPLSLFKGLSSALYGYVPADVIMFATYGFCRNALADEAAGESEETLPISKVAAAGLAAGLSYVPLVVPFEVVKIRMQVDTVGSFKDTSVFGAAQRIAQREGVGSLFRGFGATALRESSEHMIYFAAFEAIKRQIRQARMVEPGNFDHVAAMVGGGLAGGVAYLSMYPIDVVKSIIQAEEGATRGMAEVGKELFRKHGLNGFYRGAGPVVLQVLPENAVLLYTYDLVMHLLRQEHDSAAEQ